MTISRFKMSATYVKHLAKKTLCDAYLFFYKSDKEIEGYRRNHADKLKELSRRL